MARAGSQKPLGMDELVSTYENRQAGISWPIPVDARLERLLQMAREDGEPTSRREIVACILALAEVADAVALRTMLSRYRRMRVHELLSAPDDTNVVAFTQHGPGPRRRQA
jgi:hypothetical protein